MVLPQYSQVPTVWPAVSDRMMSPPHILHLRIAIKHTPLYGMCP